MCVRASVLGFGFEASHRDIQCATLALPRVPVLSTWSHQHAKKQHALWYSDTSTGVQRGASHTTKAHRSTAQRSMGHSIVGADRAAAKAINRASVQTGYSPTCEDKDLHTLLFDANPLPAMMPMIWM